MGVKIRKIHFSSFSSEPTLRFDYNYIDEVGNYAKDFYPFNTLFELVEVEKTDYPLDEPFEYAEIGNVTSLGAVEPVSLNFSDRIDELENLYKKIEKGDIIFPYNGDILVSKIRPYLKKNVLITEPNSIYFTKAFIQIRPKKIHPMIAYYLFQSKYFYKLNAISRCGKGYPTVSTDDFSALKFDKSEIDCLNNNEAIILEKIKASQAEIAELQSSKTAEIDIINKIIGEELGFDWEKFEELKKIKRTSIQFSSFANNKDCRMSYKFHNPAEKYVYDFLRAKTDKRIKDFISELIQLGESVSPADYDDDGEVYYIAMSNIRNWAFEQETCKTVRASYAENARKKGKMIQKNDILLARSSEGTIGKVALIETEVEAVFADFTQRIRLQNYIPLCAYYYFRSDIFQYLVYSHKKGWGITRIFFRIRCRNSPCPIGARRSNSRLQTKSRHSLTHKSRSMRRFSRNRMRYCGLWNRRCGKIKNDGGVSLTGNRRRSPHIEKIPFSSYNYPRGKRKSLIQKHSSR